ncbi:14-3-3-like protein F isoform X1 [Zingiber officinale]|uniref:14-3-3-like protein F isoform X1 n=2 Tax=Zingiber officinale TaxID=94328 RepID=UPI001C4D48A1|nr:14-3-3-like protein F isoform X1 [Zingiber officinale]
MACRETLNGLKIRMSVINQPVEPGLCFCLIISQKDLSILAGEAMAATREQYLYMAKLAEQTHRYENMMDYMEKVALAATVEEELTVEERNLLSAAYKNVIDALRKSLGTISSIEQSQENQGNSNRLTAIQSFRVRIETEFSSTCGRILDFIETTLIPKSPSNASKVLYLKMKGDYYRYLAEVKINGHEQHNDIVEKALSSYEIAQEAARAEFPPTHPLRLGVALNFSVFYYKILYSPVKAHSIAKQAYDEADLEQDTLQDDSFKESAEIMKRLHGNLDIWTSDMEEGETEQDQ